MTQIRLTSAVIVAGQHRNEGETLDVPSDLARRLVARGLAEPAPARNVAQDPSHAPPQPTLDLDPPAPTAPSASSPSASALAPVLADPVTSDVTDKTEEPEQEAEKEAKPSAVEPSESETEPPGEPSTAPEGDTSSSPSRKRRRR